MKPMMFVTPDLLAEDQAKLLRENGICVVVCKEPTKLRFVDPIPAVSNRTQMENAAIKLSRLLITGKWGNYSQSSVLERDDFARMYCSMLVEGASLDPSYVSPEEKYQQVYDEEKAEEMRRLARADAKAEREAKKNKA